MKKKQVSGNIIVKKNPSIQTITTKYGIIISSPNNKKDCIYYLDKGVSTKIWNLIDGKKTLNMIKNKFGLFKKIKRWESDFDNFIYDLLSKNLIYIKNNK
jgi:hypothetical protein